MKNGRILFVRTPPYDLSSNSYNVQQVGLGKAFCDLGYDFDFITFKKSNQKSWIFYENDSNKARWIEKPRLRLFRYGVNFEILHKDFLNQYDLIISQEYYQIMTYLLSRKTSNLVLYSGPYWNLFMTKIGSIFYDFLFSKSINTNVKCKFVKSDLAKQFLENKGYTDLISIGVGLDFDRFDNCIYMQEETKAVVDFMNKNNCILYVGGIDENKNYPFLLQVYAEILNVRPDVKLVIIGKSKQSWKQKLLGKKNESYELACNKNFDNRVIDGIYRVKRIDNSQLKFIYPLAKSLLLPSKKEIFGMVMLEAMYLGAPVVSSKNGGSTTLIKSNQYGKVIEEFDAKKWCSAVVEFIDNENYRSCVVNNAKELVVSRYNWKNIAETILYKAKLENIL